MTNQTIGEILPRAVQDDFSDRSAVLRPWEVSPYGLVSWWDMEQFSAHAFFIIGIEIGVLPTRIGMTLEGLPFPQIALDEPASLEFRNGIRQSTEMIAKWCEAIDLKFSALHANRFVEKLQRDDFTYNQIVFETKELRERINDEMQTEMFMHVPSSHAKYFGQGNLFGEDVTNKFPSAAFDIRESGNCLAAARYTACVFHLMRVLETGLTVLGAKFGVSLARTNWEPAIREIESKIREMHRDPKWKALADCKEQQEFYAQAASHFGVLKDAWRNYTMHVRAKYAEDEAEQILNSVKPFMQKLAERLSE